MGGITRSLSQLYLAVKDVLGRPRHVDGLTRSLPGDGRLATRQVTVTRSLSLPG